MKAFFWRSQRFEDLGGGRGGRSQNLFGFLFLLLHVCMYKLIALIFFSSFKNVDPIFVD